MQKESISARAHVFINLTDCRNKIAKDRIRVAIEQAVILANAQGAPIVVVGL